MLVPVHHLLLYCIYANRPRNVFAFGGGGLTMKIEVFISAGPATVDKKGGVDTTTLSHLSSRYC